MGGVRVQVNGLLKDASDRPHRVCDLRSNCIEAVVAFESLVRSTSLPAGVSFHIAYDEASVIMHDGTAPEMLVLVEPSWCRDQGQLQLVASTSRNQWPWKDLVAWPATSVACSRRTRMFPTASG